MYKRTLALIIAIGFQGCVYSNIALPLDTDLNQTNLGSKVGRASTHTVLWLVAWGNASTSSAAENGGIRTINHLDREIELYLFGLYSKSTTVAYGD